MMGVCGICGEPAHRFGLGDPDHDYDAMACVNMLRPALAKARADVEEMRQKVIGAREWGVTLERDLLAARADLSEARRQIQQHAADNERMQTMLAKGSGGRVIDLMQQVADWMQVGHQQESEIERLEADLDTLMKGLRPTPREWCNTHGGVAPKDHHATKSCPDRSPLFAASPEALVVLQAHKGGSDDA